MSWAWILLYLFVANFVAIARPHGYCNGRILTRPIRRRVRRFEKGLLGRVLFRASQLIVLMVLASFLPGALSTTIYFGAAIVLHLDDYLTGDDDRWRRFWESVRNKVKWKMKLPEPVVETKAAS